MQKLAKRFSETNLVKKLKIVLFQPEIPHNVGAAIRLCAGFNAELHLIRPLGFTLNNKHLERVALGYHRVLYPQVHNNMGSFLDSLAEDELLWLFSSKAKSILPECAITTEQVALLFGSETQGMNALETDLYQQLQQRAIAVKIPQVTDFRCHNLSNSIAIGIYEVQRQWGFPHLNGNF